MSEGPIRLPDPSRSETFPPLTETLPGPAGAPDPARIAPEMELLELEGEAVGGLMGSTYLSSTGGPLYRDLQEAVLVSQMVPTHLDALEVAADATSAWTRSDLVPERLTQVLLARGVRLPSDEAIRHLARTLQVLLLQGARVETIRLAVREAIGAAADLVVFPPVLVREVGRDQKQLGERATPSPSRVEVEIPFPPVSSLEGELEAVEAVTEATRPAQVVVDPGYVGEETVPPPEEDLDLEGGMSLYEDARWYFTGPAPKWTWGVVETPHNLTVPLDLTGCRFPLSVYLEVPQWGEVRREIVSPHSPLELYREDVPLQIRYGAVRGVGVRRGETLWGGPFPDRIDRIEIEGREWPVSHRLSDPKAIRLRSLMGRLNRSVRTGPTRAYLLHTPQGRATVRETRFVLTVP